MQRLCAVIFEERKFSVDFIVPVKFSSFPLSAYLQKQTLKTRIEKSAPIKVADREI